MLEGLEPRELPSTLPVAGGTASGTTATPPWVRPAILQEVTAALYAPITTTTDTTVGGQTFPAGTYAVPQPTPAEIHRETFWMEFVGHYYVGAPRFSNQSATIHIYSNGRDVTSNQTLNARAQLLLLPPADPSASPTANDPMAGQVAGLLSLFPANALQSGSSLFAEVANLPGVPSDSSRFKDHGLPAHVQFIIDPGGVTGGIYSVPAYTVFTPGVGESTPITEGNGGAVGFSQGAGEVDIEYIPTRHPRAIASRSGTAIVRVQGLLNLTGVANPLYSGIN